MQPSEYVFVSKSFERRASSVNNGEKLENVCLRKPGVVPGCGCLGTGQLLVQVEDGWVGWLDKVSALEMTGDRTW